MTGTHSRVISGHWEGRTIFRVSTYPALRGPDGMSSVAVCIRRTSGLAQVKTDARRGLQNLTPPEAKLQSCVREGLCHTGAFNV